MGGKGGGITRVPAEFFVDRPFCFLVVNILVNLF